MATTEQVAEAIVEAAHRNRKTLILSPMGKTTRRLMAFAPGLYEQLMARSLRSELQR